MTFVTKTGVDRAFLEKIGNCYETRDTMYGLVVMVCDSELILKWRNTWLKFHSQTVNVRCLASPSRKCHGNKKL